MSHRERAKATVKVTLTDPDGKLLKVIEGENPDPFGYGFLSVLHATIEGLPPTIAVGDVSGGIHIFNFATPSPSYPLGYLLPGFCLTNCPNAGSTPPNGPGIWLYRGVPSTGDTYDWVFYVNGLIIPSAHIAGLSYSPLAVSRGTSSPSSPGDIVYYLINITQSITNTLSSPVDVYTVMLIGAIYGTNLLSPVYVPITFYVFSPPIVFSPGVTMSVSVTLSFPFGIAIMRVPSPATGSSLGRYVLAV